MYRIDYGEIQDSWAKKWGQPGGWPYGVLKEPHKIQYRSGGWLGFHEWADKHGKDCFEIDWGARAWKCEGKDLIDLQNSGKAEVADIGSVVPDQTYGIVFIEEY